MIEDIAESGSEILISESLDFDCEGELGSYLDGSEETVEQNSQIRKNSKKISICNDTLYSATNEETHRK